MIAELVAQLIAAGTPPDVAASVVAQAFTAGVLSSSDRDNPRDERDERRRETDRLRQQRWRDRNAISRDKRDNPRDVTNASLSKEERIESKEGSKRETTRGSRLPVLWTPTPQDWAVASELLGEPKAKSELEKFRDHWAQQPGARGVKLDWAAAWRNWTRRSAEYSTPRNGAPNGRRTVHDAARDLHENLVARVLAFDEPAPSGLREREGEDVVRLLPPRRCE